MARLKVLVFDHVAAGGASSRLRPQSLAHQGDLLLRALLADLGALDGVEVVMAEGAGAACGEAGAGAVGPSGVVPAMPAQAHTDDAKPDSAVGAGTPAPARQHGDAAPGVAALPLPDPLDLDARLAAGLQAADAVWPLVSGSESVLECLSRSILRGNRLLLGSAPGAVEVAASKLRLARVLAEGGVAAAPTYSPHAALPQDGGPWVVKPDDGAGCLDTRLFSDRAAALAWIRASANGEYVLQPFIAGKLGSLSLICCDGTARLLACNQERVAMRDNRFHFLGSVVNGLSDSDGTLARLAQQVAAAIPSLWGYVGIDFVLTARGAVVLDVNPRLTAAYAGLHASIGCNPAGLVLDLLEDPAALPAPLAVRRAVSVDVGMS